jgi:hypothetical protein
LCGIGAAGALLIASALTTLMMPAAAVLCFLAGLIAPLRAAALQQAAAPDAGARAASIAHACDMVLSTAMVPLAGFFSARRPGRRAQ